MNIKACLIILPVIKEFKIDVNAKAGDTVVVYFKAKNAANALGIQETVKFDNLALKFKEQIGGMGHADLNTDEADKLKWSIMFDAKGSNLINESDVYIISFKALKDIKVTDDVLSYVVDEFYDVNYNDFDPASTTRGVAEVQQDSQTDTETETAKETDTSSVTDPKTDTDTSSVTDPKTDTDTSSATDPKSDTDTSTDEGETVLIGDVNGDGKITAKDSMLAQRASIKLTKLTPKQMFLGDVDEDKRVTTKDCMHILRYSIHLNSSSAVGQTRVYKE